MSGWGPPPAEDSAPTPRKKRPWPAVVLAGIGGVLLAVAFAIVAALVLALLFWQLMANIVMVIFVQELEWYGPSVYTAGGNLWWYVVGIGAVGAAAFVAGMTMLDRAGTPLRRPGRGRPA
ncbi:hypothetical protein [Sporichthya polymorpha]|uniref:hypothetical protein n=1 Tax=Sporichthya polymorpha TaxID=35751 RepID=UPI00037A298D|nr:hypothetical protein [Sporichthya polymorpha]